jgi:hypothetical protein
MKQVGFCARWMQCNRILGRRRRDGPGNLRVIPSFSIGRRCWSMREQRLHLPRSSQLRQPSCWTSPAGPGEVQCTTPHDTVSCCSFASSSTFHSSIEVRGSNQLLRPRWPYILCSIRFRSTARPRSLSNAFLLIRVRLSQLRIHPSPEEQSHHQAFRQRGHDSGDSHTLARHRERRESSRWQGECTADDMCHRYVHKWQRNANCNQQSLLEVATATPANGIRDNDCCHKRQQDQEQHGGRPETRIGSATAIIWLVSSGCSNATDDENDEKRNVKGDVCRPQLLAANADGFARGVLSDMCQEVDESVHEWDNGD